MISRSSAFPDSQEDGLNDFFRFFFVFEHRAGVIAQPWIVGTEGLLKGLFIAPPYCADYFWVGRVTLSVFDFRSKIDNLFRLAVPDIEERSLTRLNSF